ncbi:MAG: Z1 domain-containing protein [Henriciella sp.]
MSNQVESFATMVRNNLPASGGDIDAAAANVKSTMQPILGEWTEDHEELLAQAVARVRSEHQDIEILRVNSVIREKPKWYHGPVAGDRHWPALKGYLDNIKNWPEATISSVDSSSSEIVSLLDNPAQAQFSCRGLVVGYVQSGKTANMTAVIAKAVDAGYNTVVVLAGLTDKLRNQTQQRLEDDIVSLNPLLWHRLTKADRKDEQNRIIKGEFRVPDHGHLMHNPNRVQLAVMKKNVAPLRKLREAIEKTPAAELDRLKFLIIDDECDQASVNSASKELDMTRINESIREILDALPSVAYVGYTATPFANVLINPYAEESEGLDDLYPRDFITALPTPDGYFGTERLFGRIPDDANLDSSDDELDMIRDVPEEDEALLKPASRKEREEFAPRMSPSLSDAILYYLATCAVRRARGQDDKHMTMLVHTSAYVMMHNRVAGLIEAWVEQQSEGLLSRTGATYDRFCELWHEEQDWLPDDLTSSRKVLFEELHGHLSDVLSDLSVVIENGSSDDRIDYSDEPKTYIVVGGTILARGLTLEGLCVSYFLRNSSQYDTLLQMGRWFGYRVGYEDLPRIWMPPLLQMNFRALSNIEMEIRRDIAEYRKSIRPMDFAVRIRSIPGMAITARNKMRHAESCDISYWGRHVQTIRFDHKNSETLKANWRAGSDLVNLANGLHTRRPDEDRIIFEDVPRKAIVKFLREFQIQTSHAGLSNEMLLKFLDQDDERLSKWNLGVMQARTPDLSAKRLGPFEGLAMYSRTRLRNGPDEIADIKALMSRRDILFDCAKLSEQDGDSWEKLKLRREEEIGARPLLLLYPINPSSRPAADRRTSRLPLEAIAPVLGFGIVFPGSKSLAGKFVSVKLRPISADELNAIDEEEQAAAEAAGV